MRDLLNNILLGPVIYRNGLNEAPKLIGIVEKNYESSPDVYINITQFRAWINNPKVLNEIFIESEN